MNSINNRLGFYTSLLTGIATVATFVVAFLTEPLSGPLCAGSCFSYPYLDITSRFPSDYIWMYLAMGWLLLYVILMTCIHRHTSDERKTFSQIGLSFAIMSALILIATYFIQLSVVQPSLLSGEFDGISLLTQYNPHGIFIALEEIGYILMSLSFFFMAPVFKGNRLAKSVQWIFVGNFVATVIAFIIISVFYGIYREYRFEIAVISINYLTLMAVCIPLGLIFRRASETY